MHASQLPDTAWTPAASACEPAPPQANAGTTEGEQDAATLAQLRANLTLDIQAERLRSPDRNIRCDAAEKLGDFTDPRAVPLLCETLMSDGDPYVCLAAALALERCADERALPALTSCLTWCHRGEGRVSSQVCALAAALFGLLWLAYTLDQFFRDGSFSSGFWVLIVLFQTSFFLMLLRSQRACTPLMRSLARTIGRLAEGSAKVETRAALEPLRRLARDRAFQDAETRTVALQLARRIEEETGSLRNLPAPAISSAPAIESLPSPASRRRQGKPEAPRRDLRGRNHASSRDRS